MGKPEIGSEPTAQTQIQTKVVEVKTEQAVAGAWSFLKNWNLQTIIPIIGVAATLFNLYIASKLAPVAQDIASVNQAVKAQDARLDTLENSANLYLPRYIATEQQVANINGSLLRIEDTQTQLGNKIDKILLSLVK